MELTSHLSVADRERVEARLRHNLMAWLTSVRQPAYVAKYLERIDALFGTPEKFAERFSAAVIITPTKLFT